MSVDTILRLKQLKSALLNLVNVVYSHASRHKAGGGDPVEIDASQITSGTISTHILPTQSIVILLAGDDTEITTTSTSYPASDEKYFLFVNLFSYTTLRVAIEGKVTSGNTLTVGIFKGGTLQNEIQFTETSYVVKTTDINVSDIGSTSTTQIGIRTKVNGGTGYQRVLEFYGVG